MPPAEHRTEKAENGAPGKSSPAIFAFIYPRPPLRGFTIPDRPKAKPPRSLEGSALPISNGASPIASALGIRLGATPRGPIHPNSQPRRNPAKQDISTLLGLGHFYFALTQQAPKSYRARSYRTSPKWASICAFMASIM
jgi:hypothetical protein